MTELALMLVSLVTFLLAIVNAYQLGLHESEPSNRARFHAIPVALSQLFHDRAHDYTANWSIAVDFQGSKESTQSLIDKHKTKTPPATDGDYYWAADDRGFSDFVYVSFALFGAELSSLFYFWFSLLGISLLLALIRFCKDPAALVIVTTVMIGLGAGISTYETAANQFSFQEASIHISESRMFGLLGAMALVHLLLTVFRSDRSVSIWLNWSTAILQIGLITFLLHNRSTILWIFLALILVCGMLFVYRRFLQGSGHNWKAAAVTVVLLLCSFFTLKAFQLQMFNPAYFAEIGPRTVWHNAIMGTAYSPALSEKFKMVNVSDAAAIEAVILDMKQRDDPRLTDDWERQNILNSLGGHNGFDWVTYEIVAKELLLRTLSEYPMEAFKMFFWYKPIAVVDVLWCYSVETSIGCTSEERSAHSGEGDTSGSTEGSSALSWLWVVLAAVTAGVYHVTGRKRTELPRQLFKLVRQISLPLVIVLLVGLLPAYIFYPSTASSAGATAILLTIIYLGIVMFSFSVFQFFSNSKI